MKNNVIALEHFKITPNDAMYVYCWWDKSHPEESKFGEKWVKAGEIPDSRVKHRIRESLGVEKHIYDQGDIVIEAIWDVSEYAKRAKKYFKQSRMDDFIRKYIGFRKNPTGEMHTLPGAEMAYRVNEHLKKQDSNALVSVGLSQLQYDSCENVITAIRLGKRRILAELCARLGKTIFAGALIKETNAPVSIIASYVLTSFASFKKDLSSYIQFKNFAIIDTSNIGWEEAVEEGIAQGKQIVAFVSMCNGTNRSKKLKHLFDMQGNKLVIVDEADYGSHQVNQANALREHLTANDVVVLMTGTNGDRAAGCWTDTDHYLSVTYPELILDKRHPKTIKSNTLRYFTVDSKRAQLVVDVEFYQMDMMAAVEQARKLDPTLFVEDGKFLPGWTKFAANPVKAQGFFTTILQAIFESKHNLSSLHFNQIIESSKSKVAMMFLPGSMTTAHFKQAVEIAEQALKGYTIVAISGDEMTNGTAEQATKEAIFKAQQAGKNVLIMSFGMAQRSYSIPEIDELYLAYDVGGNGPTIQKMSRALTPSHEGKIGRIISLSFDPNRDDKFDALLIETAQNYKKNNGISDLKTALRIVINTVDIFNIENGERVKISPADYLQQALSRNSIARVIGKVADLSNLSLEQLTMLAEGNANASKLGKVDKAQIGKTSDSKKTSDKEKKEKTNKDFVKMMAKAREVIVTVAENLDVLTLGTSTKNIASALILIEQDSSLQAAVFEEFGVNFCTIQWMFEHKVINSDLVELLINV